MHSDVKWKEQLANLHDESYRWCLACCSYNRETAKDVLQSVYLKIYEGRAVFNEKSSLKTWLFSVIRNTSLDYYRKRALRIVPDGGEFVIDPHVVTDQKERQKVFREILAVLSGQQREVLTLAFYHDMTLEEIAGLLKLSIGTVRTHYSRGKENFAKWLMTYEKEWK